MLIWLPILGVALALGASFQRIGLPAPWLLGPMMTGLAFGCSALETPRVHRRVFTCAQTIVGIVVAGAIHPAFVGLFATHWWLMIVVVTATAAAAGGSAWFLARSGTLAVVTATLGMMPAGAAVMTGLAVDLDADPRVVAFLQYIRIVLVLSTVSLVVRFIFRIEWHAPPSVTQAASPATIAITLLVAAVGATAGHLARLPGAPVLGPLILGGALSVAGIIHIGLPGWLLDIAYVTMGLFVGLRFTIHSVLYVLKILWRLLAANVALLVACGFVGTFLVKIAHVDPLTAYLATSPGGMDTITIIAVGGGADVGTIVVLQTARSFIVTALGPALARFAAQRSGHYSAAASSS